MVKRALFLFLLIALLLWSCATYQPPTPSFFVENLPPSIVSELTLDERLLVEDAWKDLRNGKGNKAKERITHFRSESPVYQAGLAYAYFVLNDYAMAERLFKEALKDYPDMVLIHVGLAQIYSKTAREQQAFSEYREILKRDPDHPWAKPKYEDSKKSLTEEALSEAKNFLAQGDREKSKEAFLRALHFSPDFIEAHLALARLFKEENKLQNALVHLKAASSNDSQNKDILKSYGEMLFEAKNYKESLEIYEKLQNLEPENQEIKDRLQAIKNRLGIFELPSQYDAIPLAEAVSREEMAALLGVKFKDILEEPSIKPPIIIDISTSWASKFILKAASLGILDVYPNHTFQPQKKVTRAEMADILNRLIENLKNKGYKFIQQIPPEMIQIQDVTPGHYYYRPITSLVSYNIMTLTRDKAFNPEMPVSGKDSIKFLDVILALIK